MAQDHNLSATKDGLYARTNQRNPKFFQLDKEAVNWVQDTYNV